MKKRQISLLLAAFLVVGSLSGCGQTATEEGSGQAATEVVASAETATAESSAEATEESKAGYVAPETFEVYQATMPTAAEEADIYVEPIENLPADFIKGMDISTVLVEEASGVVYYDKNGQEADLFRVLADAGVNYIRVRVWNDPYDAEGRGYGGGNNDAEKAAIIGRRAAENGMKLSVDFHYSDFWADPSKQFAPKEWKHLTLEDKKTAIYEYTKDSLYTILAAGADVGMVQIGNEINNGMSGEKDSARIMELLKQASKAVREVSAESGKDIKIAVHYTNIEDYNKIMGKAKWLADNELDYDIFGVSYYNFWHGTMENLTKVLNDITVAYGKETAVMETSYAYTVEDGDGTGNTVDENDLVSGYAATVQSQANCVRDVMAAANAGGALGVFYWEGAWIPVGTEYESNSKIWEEQGSGWASSYASKYDPNDAGQYYGGCSWDNQALFDFTGHPLASLDVFKYVNYGTICEPAIDYLEECEIKVNIGDKLVMPEGIPAVYNNRALSKAAPVTWDEAQLGKIDTSKAGLYLVDGILKDGTEITCEVEVASVNWIENESFEEKRMDMWKVTYEGASNPTDVQNKESDALTGVNSFHFWSESAQEFRVEQTVSGLSAGKYTAKANIQGGDVGSDAEIYLYVIVNGEEITSDPVKLAGWVNWQIPTISDIELGDKGEITVGMSVKCAAKGWGTMDDFELFKQ